MYYPIAVLLCGCGDKKKVISTKELTWNIYELRNGGAACRNEGGKSVAHETDKLKKKLNSSPLNSLRNINEQHQCDVIRDTISHQKTKTKQKSHLFFLSKLSFQFNL